MFWLLACFCYINLFLSLSLSQLFCFCTHNWWLICAESCYHMHKSKHFLPMEMEQLILSPTHFPMTSCPLVPFSVSQSILFISYFTSQLHISTLSLSFSIYLSLFISVKLQSRGSDISKQLAGGECYLANIVSNAAIRRKANYPFTRDSCHLNLCLFPFYYYFAHPQFLPLSVHPISWH